MGRARDGGPALADSLARDEAKAGREEAFELALTGLPVVIVWDLVVSG